MRSAARILLIAACAVAPWGTVQLLHAAAESPQQQMRGADSPESLSGWVDAMSPLVKQVYLSNLDNMTALTRLISHEPLMATLRDRLSNLVHENVLGSYPAPILNAIVDLASFKGLKALLKRFPKRETDHEWIGVATELTTLAELHNQGHLAALPKSYKMPSGAEFEVDGWVHDENGPQFLEIKRVGYGSPDESRDWLVKTTTRRVLRASNRLDRFGLIIFALTDEPRDQEFLERTKRHLSTRPQNRMPFRVAFITGPAKQPPTSPVQLLFEPAYLQLKARPAAASELDGTPGLSSFDPLLRSHVVSPKAKTYYRTMEASLGSRGMKWRYRLK